VLAKLGQEEELVLVQGGALVSRLKVSEQALAPTSGGLDDLAPEEQVAEVMSQFNAMIHDEF
jgi:hypothetical protein